MILILICTALVAIGWAYMVWRPHGDLDFIAAMFACVVGAVGLVMCMMTLPKERMEWQSKFREIEAIRASRVREDPIEGAAWRMKAAEVNAEIAKGRYYNQTVFDIWIPDQIESVEPIK